MRVGRSHGGDRTGARRVTSTAGKRQDWISLDDLERVLNAFVADTSNWNAPAVEALIQQYALGAPFVLYKLAHTRFFPEHLVRPHVAPAWLTSRRPTLVMIWPAWRALFDRVGYTVDGEAARRPAESVTMWRGAHRNYRLNHSWTTDRTLAVAFAKGPGRSLWRAEVEPRRMMLTMGGHEPQTILDTDGMTVHEEPLSRADLAVPSFHDQRRRHYAEAAQTLDAEGRKQLEAYANLFAPWEDLTL